MVDQSGAIDALLAHAVAGADLSTRLAKALLERRLTQLVQMHEAQGAYLAC